MLTTACNPKQHHGKTCAPLVLVRSKRQAGFGWFGALVMMLLTLLIGSSRASAEAWVPIAPPPAISDGSTATALADGRILLAGGYGEVAGVYGESNAAYLYDPSTNVWTVAGQMRLATQNHAAALLPSGKVLITGGYTGSGNFTRRSEIFDPASLSWTTVAGMTDGRYLHSLTALLDGRVLVTGGNAFTAPFPRRAELFDEKTMSWTAAGMIDATGRSTATLLGNGEVLVVGGEGSSAPWVSQIFNPTTMKWRTTAPLRDARWSHAAALMADGSVLVSGGFNGPVGVESAERFDPATESWSVAPPPLVARANHRLVTVADGRTLSIGGSYPPSVEALQPSMPNWVAQNPLNYDSAVLVVKTPNGRVYAIGNTAETLVLSARPSAGHVDPIWRAAGRAYALVSSAETVESRLLRSTFDRRTGNVVVVTPCRYGSCIARFDRRGVLDLTFGAAGIATLANGYVTDIKVLPDGKIIMSGTCNSLCLFKLNENGSADTTFGVNGQTVADIGNMWSLARLSVTNIGEIYVAGDCGAINSRALCATKFNARGTVDSAFGIASKPLAPLIPTRFFTTSLAVDASGALAVVGQCAGVPCTFQFSPHAALATPEDSSRSIKLITFAVGYGAQPLRYVSRSETLADGRTLTAHSCVEVSRQTEKVCVIKLDTDGKIDPSYGKNGYVLLDAFSGCDNRGFNTFSMVATPDGQAVILSQCSVPDRTDDLRVIRLDASGQIDHTYAGPTGLRFAHDAALVSESNATLLFSNALGFWNSNTRPLFVTSYRFTGEQTDATKPMIEYRYAPLDYYFLTGRESEQKLLDGAAGWQRTGEAIAVFHTDAINRSPLYRFYFDQVARSATRGSHFYTLIDSERAALDALNPPNLGLPRIPVNEYVDGFASAVDAAGNCAASLQPVYRLFRGNARFPDDPNHRFTTKRALYDQFVAAGWTGEGVRFCAPLTSR